MVEAQSVITDILTRIDYCEFCDTPAGNVGAFEIYTIDKCDTINLKDLYRNIIVLCPDCKKNFDDGLFSKKHLKACVILRNPELSEWLKDLFGQYDIPHRLNTDRKGLRSMLDQLVDNPRYLNNAVFLFGFFLIALGIILFAYGYSNVYEYNNGAAANGNTMAPPDYTFSLFLEIAGVICALLGLFFELGLVRNPAKISYR